jgi:hypothetical protein
MSDIKQINLFFQEAISAMEYGNLAKAPFNRDYAWTQEDVILFFESIKKQYPIGNIITWRPEEQKEWNDRLGPIMITESPYYYIVDGHNRLATMAYSMTLPQLIEPIIPKMTEQEKKVWGNGQTLTFNLETTDINFIDNEELKTLKNHIPIGMVTSKYLNQYLLKNPKKFDIDNDVILDNIDDMARKIRETKLLNLFLNKTPAEEAIDAFVHLSKVGQPMTKQDIDNAKEWFLNHNSNSLKM